MADEDGLGEEQTMHENKTVKIGWLFIQLKIWMLVLETISLTLIVLQLILNFAADLISKIIITSLVTVVIVLQLISILVVIRKDRDFKIMSMKKMSNVIKQSSEEQIPLNTKHDKKESSSINLK